MDINVKITVGAEPELVTHLATLVECVKDVLKVSNAQMAAAESEKEKPKKKAAPKPAEKKAEPLKTEEPKPEPQKAEQPVVEDPKPEPVKEEAPAEDKADKAATVTETELRAFCMDFVKKDPANKTKLAAAFKSVGADKLSTVKAEDYQKVIDYLNGAAQ